MTTNKRCPTPIGLGAALRYAYVGICLGGVAAFAVGKSISEIDIVNIINKAVAIPSFFVFIVFSLQNLFSKT
jgi:ABC-type dipeptide/oligopeptide/nickel transport system permease subunit